MVRCNFVGYRFHTFSAYYPRLTEIISWARERTNKTAIYERRESHCSAAQENRPTTSTLSAAASIRIGRQGREPETPIEDDSHTTKRQIVARKFISFVHTTNNKCCVRFGYFRCPRPLASTSATGARSKPPVCRLEIRFRSTGRPDHTHGRTSVWQRKSNFARFVYSINTIYIFGESFCVRPEIYSGRSFYVMRCCLFGQI